MTDHNVFVFGSFTEDDTKSLQSSPNENDVQFMFGSLDAATLRSVGFNYRSTETKITKKSQPSKLVKNNNTDEIVYKNWNAHDSSSLSFSNGIKEHEQKNEEPPASFAPRSVDQSISRKCVSEAETFVRSFEALDVNDAKDSIFSPPIIPYTSATELLPRGLVNSGNLCFLNATLQALLACSPFVRLLQELRMRNIPEIAYPTLRAFVEFISGFDMPPGRRSKKEDEFLLETGKPLRPVMFDSVLNNFSPDMPNSFSGRPRQEDAQEFLSFVMHQLHDELLKFEGQISLVNGGKVSLVSSVSDEDGDSWETVGPRNKTAITRKQSFIPSKLSEIFGGQLKSVVKARGNKASATIEPFLLLHLNICREPVHTIEDALRLFSAPEMLEGYRASSAGKAELVSASKSVKILELPDIIILHLMRFSYGSQGSTKLLKPVYYPLELILNRELLVLPTTEFGLNRFFRFRFGFFGFLLTPTASTHSLSVNLLYIDVKVYVDQPSPSPFPHYLICIQGRKYELVATITHHGREPSKGHYTSDILHTSGKWLRYDDALVVNIPINKVLHDQAYVLFYKQQ